PASGPVFAFAGIGNPKAFFDDLGRTGVEVVGTLSFPDHHHYSAADLERIAARAREAGGQTIVTTQKDAMNLTGYGLPLVVAGMKLMVEEEDKLMDRVVSAVRK